MVWPRSPVFRSRSSYSKDGVFGNLLLPDPPLGFTDNATLRQLSRAIPTPRGESNVEARNSYLLLYCRPRCPVVRRKIERFSLLRGCQIGPPRRRNGTPSRSDDGVTVMVPRPSDGPSLPTNKRLANIQQVSSIAPRNGVPGNFRRGKRDATQFTVHPMTAVQETAALPEKRKASTVRLKICCTCAILAPVLFSSGRR
jgi:hypothetical protein